MRLKTWFGVLAFLSSICFAEPSYITFPSDVPWVTQESDHFQIIFREGQKDFALRSLRAAERAHRLLMQVFPEAPPKTWIVLADFQDSTNGYALNFPYSHIVIFAAPPDATGQLAALDRWLESVILHEYVHILHLYPAHGVWSLMRTIFGTWVVPNGMMPSHFHEGMAAFFETELSNGGRGRSAHFGMYRRKAAEEGAWGSAFAPIDIMDGTIQRWPHGVSPYFWGVTLHQELWLRKGKQGFRELTLSHSDNWPYFQNIPLKEVYGTTYSELWREIFIKTDEEAKAEIAAIKKTPLSKLDYLTTSGYRKLDPTLSPDETKVAFRIDSPYRDNGGIIIYDLKTKTIEKDYFLSLGQSESLCWGKKGDTEEILYVSAASESNYSTNSISAISPTTGKTRSVGGSHVHRVDCRRDMSSIFYYEEVGGEGVIKEADADLKEKRNWRIPTGTWVSSILATRPPVFTLRKGVETSFYRWNDGQEPKLLFVLNGSAFGLQPGKDPNEFYSIAPLDGRDEVWKFDLARRTVSKVVSVIGGINGFVKSGNTFVVSSYEHHGNNAGYDLAFATPIAAAPIAIPEGAVPKDDEKPLRVSEIRNYSPFSTLFPRTWLPSMLFVPEGIQFGALIPWFDLSQKHVYSLYGGYDTRGVGFGDINYNYRFARKYTLDAGAYYSPSYLTQDRTFLKRMGGSIGLSTTIPYFPPSIHFSAIYRRQDAAVIGTFPIEESQSIGFELGLSYSLGFARRPLSISPVNGAKFSLAHALFFKSLGSSHNYFTNVASIDLYREAPWWRDSVFFLRTKLGYTEGAPRYTSYFEGGGEVLFSQGRGAFLNRGFSNGAFFARRILNANVEYRFPIKWVERGSGIWPFKLNVIHAALVADGTTSDFGTSSYYTDGTKVPENLLKENFYSAGVELKTDWKFFFYLPTLLRVGVYHGFGGPYSQDMKIVFGAEASI